jgi:WD40 repeat protein
LLRTILMIIQAGIPCKWASDSRKFLLEHFNSTHNSPSHTYHSALPFCLPSSWIYKCYNSDSSQEVKVVRGLPAEWGACSHTIPLDGRIISLTWWNTIIAGGSEDGDIIILDAVAGNQTAIFSGHTGKVSSLVFLSDGKSLVSGSYDKSVRLWDMQTGGVVKTFSGHTSRISSISISADSATVASGSHDKSIRLWNIYTGKCYHVIKQEDTVYCVKFSPTNPHHLLSICNGKIWQWDINGNQVGSTHDGYDVAFSPDGAQFAMCNKTAVTVWNSSSGEILAELHTNNPCNCCFSPDCKLIAATDYNTIYIWDITNSEVVESFVEYAGLISTLFFSSPSTFISAVYGQLVSFWQIGSPSIDLAETDPGSTTLTSASILLTLQANDDVFITYGLDKVLKVWEISTGICKASFQTPTTKYSQCDALLINSRLIFAWSTGKTINAWDAMKGEVLWAVDVQNDIRGIKISGDGSRVFCLDQKFIQALSIQMGKVMGQAKIRGPSFHPYLTADGSKVWVQYTNLEYQGWDFGILGSSPVQLRNVFPERYYFNSAVLWDIGISGIRNEVTGKVIFQVPKRYGRAFDAQWHRHQLVIGFESNEMLVLDFSNVLQ